LRKVLTDNQLMLQVRDGDVDKLGHLFERHNVKLFNFFLKMTSNRELSEDLVQEVFLRMLKYRQTYRGDGNFNTWMFQIARNARIDYFRKQKNEIAMETEIDLAISEEPNPESQFDQNQEANMIRKALNQLPEEKREILVLSRYQNVKYEEIAKLHNCKVGTIKAKVHRALKDLSKIYSNLTGERI